MSVTVCILGDEGKDPSGAMWQATLEAKNIDHFWLAPQAVLAQIEYGFSDLATEASRNPYAIAIDEGALRLSDDASVREAHAYIPTGATYPTYGRYLSGALDSAGLVQPNNWMSAERARDKWATHVALSNAGLPVPLARLVKNRAEADAAVAELAYPLVIKEPMSYAGKGVRLAANETEFVTVLEELDLERHPLMIEQYIECNASDKRAVVLKDEIVGVVKRTAREGEFRSNLTLGARGEAGSLSPEETQIALRMAEVLDLEFVGLDIAQCTETLPGRENLPEGSYFCIEGNPTPGICGGLFEHTGIDVSPPVVDRLIERVAMRSVTD